MAALSMKNTPLNYFTWFPLFIYVALGIEACILCLAPATPMHTHPVAYALALSGNDCSFKFYLGPQMCVPTQWWGYE